MNTSHHPEKKNMEPRSQKQPKESPWILRLQLMIVVGFSFFTLGVIIWIGRLIYVSWDLQDTFSGSIGIALVAGVVFCVLLSVFHYVFWGIRAGAAGLPEDKKKQG